MDNQEAKFILQAYRPNGADANEVRFSDALEQARRDPELAKWFEREQALDRAVAQKLRIVVPPTGLRETILAGGRVSQVVRPWWQRSGWVGLAASVVLAAGLVVAVPQLRRDRSLNPAEVERLSSLVKEDTLHSRHGSKGEPANRLQAFLSDPAVRLASSKIPVDVDQLRATGCRGLTLGGHEVLEVCFVRSGKEYHLYVMTRLDQMPRSPRIEGDVGPATAAWGDGRHGYVLATLEGAAALRALL